MASLLSWFAQLLKSDSSVSPSPSADVELSFSRVQAYQRCPWMYHLIYEAGWRSGPRAPMALGMSLHRALAAYLAPENAEKTWDRLAEIYDAMWVNEGFSSTQQTLDTYDSGRKMLEKFFEQDRARATTVVATEKEFDVPLAAGIRFRGTVDRLDQRGDGGYEVVEYKTQGDHWTGSRIDGDLQMTLYALGMEVALGAAPSELKYHFLSNGETVTTRRSEAQLKSAAKLLADIAEKIRGREFSPNTAHCGRCEFGTRCVNFKKEPATA